MKICENNKIEEVLDFKLRQKGVCDNWYNNGLPYSVAITD